MRFFTDRITNIRPDPRPIENVIANDNDLSGMDLKAADMLDLSFLERLEEERKTKAR